MAVDPKTAIFPGLKLSCPYESYPSAPWEVEESWTERSGAKRVTLSRRVMVTGRGILVGTAFLVGLSLDDVLKAWNNWNPEEGR